MFGNRRHIILIGGKHFTADENGVPIESADQSKAFRKNFAGIGFKI